MDIARTDHEAFTTSRECFEEMVGWLGAWVRIHP